MSDVPRELAVSLERIRSELRGFVSAEGVPTGVQEHVREALRLIERFLGAPGDAEREPAKEALTSVRSARKRLDVTAKAVPAIFRDLRLGRLEAEVSRIELEQKAMFDGLQRDEARRLFDTADRVLKRGVHRRE